MGGTEEGAVEGVVTEHRGTIEVQRGLRLAEGGAVVRRADGRASNVDDRAGSAAADNVVAMRLREEPQVIKVNAHGARPDHDLGSEGRCIEPQLWEVHLRKRAMCQTRGSGQRVTRCSRRSR